MPVELKPVKLVCPEGHAVDFIYLTKSDLMLLEPPEVIIASAEAVAARLGDPLVSRALKGVKLVVVDEAHTASGYRGVHVAMIIRRLLLLSKEHNPLLVISSATIANPGELARVLNPYTGDVEVMRADDYRGSEIHSYAYYLFVAPSESVSHETATTATAFHLSLARSESGGGGGKVLVFTNSRSAAERIARYVLDRGETTLYVEDPSQCPYGQYCVAEVDPASGKLKELLIKAAGSKCVVVTSKLNDLVRELHGKRVVTLKADFHHAGLKKEDRVKCEQEFKSGALNVLASTSTLELGVDVGDLDNIVLHGFPLEVASFFQRAGRGGRRAGRNPVIVTIVGRGWRDVYYYVHVDPMLEKPHEFFRVEIPLEGNVYLLASHVTSYALERGLLTSSPATLPTAMLAASPRIALDDLLRDVDKIVEEVLPDVSEAARERVKEVVFTTLDCVREYLKMVERCSALRSIIALSSLKAWHPVVDSKEISCRLSLLIDEALGEVMREAAQVLGDLVESEFVKRDGLRGALRTVIDMARYAPERALGYLRKMVQGACPYMLCAILDESLRILNVSPERGEELDEVTPLSIAEVLGKVRAFHATFLAGLAEVVEAARKRAPEAA